MHINEIIVIAIAIVPVLILISFRINAAVAFMSLCLGYVLVQFVSPDSSAFMTLFSTSRTLNNVVNSGGGINIFLLLLPLVLTSVFMVHTVRGLRLLINILPAIGVGLVGILFVVPLLPYTTQHNIINSSFWFQLHRSQDLAVGMSALASLLVLWLQRPKSGHESHKKHNR